MIILLFFPPFSPFTFWRDIFEVKFPGVLLGVSRPNLGPIGLAVLLIVRQIVRPHFIIDFGGVGVGRA